MNKGTHHAWSANDGLAVLLVTILAGLMPSAVGAHAILVESVPAQGAVLEQSPPRIVLRFNAMLEGSMSRVRLRDIEQVGIALEISQESGTRLDRIVAGVPTLSPGVYTVEYKVLARDGHVTEGSIRFTILGR